MARRLSLRVLELVIVLLLVSFGVFMLLSLVSGDPAIAVLGPGHSKGEYAALNHRMGLDQPLLTRYLSWLGHAVTGNLGTSLLPPYTGVGSRLAAAFPVSIELTFLGLFLAIVLAIPLAMWSAYREDGWIDRTIGGMTFGLLSVPSFLAGLILIAVFANGLGWFPPGQWVRLSADPAGNLLHAFLPACTIALTHMAMYTRILRNDLVTTLKEDYILAARARGMPPARIMASEALRPSSFTLITLLGLSVGQLIGSTVIVEYLFGLPGVGQLMISSATQGNFPMVQGAVLVIAVTYVLMNALIDLSYGYLDPRIRRARA